jgi:hypothetical protein
VYKTAKEVAESTVRCRAVHRDYGLCRFRDLLQAALRAMHGVRPEAGVPDRKDRMPGPWKKKRGQITSLDWWRSRWRAAKSVDGSPDSGELLDRIMRLIEES